MSAARSRRSAWPILMVMAGARSASVAVSAVEFGASRSSTPLVKAVLPANCLRRVKLNSPPLISTATAEMSCSFAASGRLRALRADLTELWSTLNAEPQRDILPAVAGRSATVILHSGLGLDGKTGKPIWSVGQPRAILAASGNKSLPRAVTARTARQSAACPFRRLPRQLTLRPRASPADPISPRDDPRWARRLPWVAPVEPATHPFVHLAFAATLVNVCIPWSILWLATRRHFLSMRLLLALPAAVAIALSGSMTVIDILQSRNPPGPGIGYWISCTVLLSLSGLPIVAYVFALASCLIRRNWRKASLLVAGAGLAAIVIAAGMFGVGNRCVGPDRALRLVGLASRRLSGCFCRRSTHTHRTACAASGPVRCLANAPPRGVLPASAA